MGRKLREKVTCSPMQNNHRPGGFMWGLFDILKHNHWRYIKKRLPHKRPHLPGGATRTSASTPSLLQVSGQRPKKKPSSAVKSNNSGEKPKKQHNNTEDKSKNLNSEEKRRKTHSEIKRSVKALIKALVMDDKSSKKNGRHHRSSTYPVQSNPKEKESSLSELESSDKNSLNGDERNRVFDKTIGISPAIGSLNPLYLMSEESSNSDSEEFRFENTLVDDTDENKSDFDESDSKKKKKKDEEDAWLDPKLRHEDDDTSPRRAKSCLDALNLIHMNRNFLLKVLQDPGSPLARHFQSQQSFSSKTMTKAGSFPTTHGSNREDHINEFENKSMTSPSIAAQHRADGVQTFNEAMEKASAEAMEKASADEEEKLSGSGHTRKRGKNHQVVIKRFKDLRQKIKHVINENKNETHRITMDAVLDKVPRKYGFSKDLRHDVLKGSSSANKAEGAKPKQIRRTSSLCGSVDRYLQLYEKSFQKCNSTTSEKSEEQALSCKIVPKILGRILSSPEMKSPYALKIDDLPAQLTTFSRSMEQEQDGLEDISEISEDHSEHEMPETTQDPSSDAEQDSPTFDEMTCESQMPQDSEIQQDADTESVLRSKQVTGAEIEEVVQVEAQDKGKFNYVRDILEISGFNAPESLSVWQSEYQPLDPLVYEEVTTTTTRGCMIQDPECSSNEEEGGGNCNHLLLFDLINEVLIEIYERCYHYCPKPLSPLCRVHPMAVGYSVLKEVWIRINCYLRYKPLNEESFYKIMSRDFRREDGWMDLQFESECVGIEVEDMIFEELLEELLLG
ncbi:unnamed protein product [Eruca vesicaria subsp. sativa]|uniref:DUF4378 domain-containing protein n=1 Tax=Eruca vesicaria subsp. sativa TaxID=29727 RepID=A0ABC8LAE2_ERUVS|nr:unnamed protein product [Eruca vesicaria subsp. sativa]